MRLLGAYHLRHCEEERSREFPSRAKPCILAAGQKAGARWCWAPGPQVRTGSLVVVQMLLPEHRGSAAICSAPVQTGRWPCWGQSSSHRPTPSTCIAEEGPGQPHRGAGVLLPARATASPGIPKYSRAISATLKMSVWSACKCNVQLHNNTWLANVWSFQTCSASPARWLDLLEISAGKAAAVARGCAPHHCPVLPALPSCTAGQKGKHCPSPADSKHALSFEAFERIWLGWRWSLRSTQRGMQKVLALGGWAVCRCCWLPAAPRSGCWSRYRELEESPCQAGGRLGHRTLIPCPADMGFSCCLCWRSVQMGKVW